MRVLDEWRGTKRSFDAAIYAGAQARLAQATVDEASLAKVENDTPM